MEGRLKCCQSGEAPWRTIRALVKAAKVMVMAARPTQMPVLAGGGEESFTRRKSPLVGARFCPPPLPEPRLGRWSSSIFGGSWIVVAILLSFPGNAYAQGLKPKHLRSLYGAAEAAPFKSSPATSR